MRPLPDLSLPLTTHTDDPHSFAEPAKVVITHVELDLAINFAHKALTGHATLTLDWRDAQAKALALDTEALTIAGIEAIDADGSTRPLRHKLARVVPSMGRKLTITTPRQPRQVRIHYTTAPTASGLQWLTPAQTADQTHPFMFSQSEATHARSWIPLQDSPAIRFSWNARIRLPKDMRAVMSATNNQARHVRNGDFRFTQEHPVPAYLLAIAAGKLAVREVGPRTAVYAEPSVVKAAAREFEDTEKMITTTEKLYGPYPWGRYDILVLPPSFPFGGMENPCMTFATPTVLVGDKSLVSLIAHELAHSWSGNLVTSATWRNIWLNEGVTTYVQGRITEALYGKRQANEETLLAIHALGKSIKTMTTNAQRLAPKPTAVAADDTLTRLPYDKGSWFMRTLEARFGRKRFDAWLKSYFKHFAWHSIDTEQMLAHLKAHLIDKYPGVMDWAEVEHWVYAPGLPKDAPIPAVPRFAAIDRKRAAFLKGTLAADQLGAADWNTQEWMHFLDGLPERTPLKRLAALDAAWQLTGTPNAEIGMRWYRRAIAAGSDAVRPAAAEHMQRIGRMYLTLPLYHAFAKTPEGMAFAAKIYARAKAGYHPLTQHVVERAFAQAKQHAKAPAKAKPRKS